MYEYFWEYMKSNDIIMTFSLLCKNKVVEKPLDHMKNHELDKNRKISIPNTVKMVLMNSNPVLQKGS